MLKLSANLAMLFREVGFVVRFARASMAGFKGVEYWFAYEWDKDQLAEQLNKHCLEQVLFNLPAGDWLAGERGFTYLPGQTGEFKEGARLAIAYAKALKCSRLNCLAGITPEEVPTENRHQTIPLLREG